jgi:hypothetical protein
MDVRTARSECSRNREQDDFALAEEVMSLNRFGETVLVEDVDSDVRDRVSDGDGHVDDSDFVIEVVSFRDCAE